MNHWNDVMIRWSDVNHWSDATTHWGGANRWSDGNSHDSTHAQTTCQTVVVSHWIPCDSTCGQTCAQTICQMADVAHWRYGCAADYVDGCRGGYHSIGGSRTLEVDLCWGPVASRPQVTPRAS
jgi:hypothetical protein